MTQYINLGLLAHVDAGKTTTVEQLLYQCGQLRNPGNVDAGNTQTDWLDIERERGISVKSASVRLSYKDITINILDTPGHMDFAGEVERALSVLDAVVLVLSAADGIQSQTERFWDAITALKLPVLIFVNKIDRVGHEPHKTTLELRKRFCPSIIELNEVTEAGSSECTVTPRQFDEEDILRLCDGDDTLAEMYLSGDTLSQPILADSLKKQTASCAAAPLVYGSAIQSVGIDFLLDALTAYLPHTKTTPDGEPSGVVYKIEFDKGMGKAAHIRMYEGSIRNRDLLELNRPNESEPVREKVTQIRRIYGGKREDSGVLSGGDIGAVYGLTGAKTGDTFGRVINRPELGLAVPLLSVQLLADNMSLLLEAVSELSDEDPLMSYWWDTDEQELSVRIMGKIQLEVLVHTLKSRYSLDVKHLQPSVIYKETPLHSGIGFEAYTMPKPCWAVIKLQIDPLPRGSGYLFESVTPDKNLFYRYQEHVRTSVPETLRQGLYGWEVTDLKVTLIDGEHHHVHTHPLDFFLATPIAVMKALTDCGSQLLEPMLKMRLIAPELLSGKLMGDIIAMRGEFDSPVITEGNISIDAYVPAATSIDYPVRFASLTSGKGRISLQFNDYKECPLELGAVTKRRGVNPLDRAKWILHKRGAY